MTSEGNAVDVAHEQEDNRGFPRRCTQEEIQEWVDEARRRTDPMLNWRRGCIICGRVTRDLEMMGITISDLIMLRGLLRETSPGFLEGVDPAVLQYKGGLSAINGLPIDRNGILSADELVEGAPVIGQGCRECYKAIRKGLVPEYALGNRLWTGIEIDTPLSDLTWIEEKLIARIHISVQIQKCRAFHAAAADGFHSQRQIKGHILSYPMEPTTVLNRLPLAPAQLIGLIKVVFLSRKPITRTDANNLRFYIVRRAKVANALHWLIENNPQYRDISIDAEALGQLPEDGIPEVVYDTLTVSSRSREDLQGHSRYDMPDEGMYNLQFFGVPSFAIELQ